eukprot:scaffold279912_cov15-Tisochrysis_lutea.AAC.1
MDGFQLTSWLRSARARVWRPTIAAVFGQHVDRLTAEAQVAEATADALMGRSRHGEGKKPEPDRMLRTLFQRDTKRHVRTCWPPHSSGEVGRVSRA